MATLRIVCRRFPGIAAIAAMFAMLVLIWGVPAIGPARPSDPAARTAA